MGTEAVTTELIRNDGAMLAAFGAMGNHTTGLGTQRDKSQHGEVNTAPPLLSRRELSSLFRKSKLIQKVVCLLPQDSTKKWGHIALAKNEEIPDFEAYEQKLNVRDRIAAAGIQGRLMGDGYVVMCLDDGLMWNEPVNEAGIREIKWLKVLSGYDLIPEYSKGGYEDPEHYLFSLDNTRWPDDALPRQIHKSRVLRIPGCKLPESILQDTNGCNDSIVYGMYKSYANYISSLDSSSAMLADYSVFVYGLNGLSDMLMTVDEAGQEKAREQLLNRFLAIQMGMSTVKGLMIDAENEQADFINRNYAGVDDIIGRLQEILVGDSGMPRSKLLGGSETGAFSEGGLSDRYEWADCVSNYQNLTLTSAIKQLYRYVMLAKDGPTRGAEPVGWQWQWLDTLQLTRLEQAQLEETYAKGDAIRIRTKVLHPMEIRDSRYGTAEFGLSVSVDDKWEAELNKPAPEPITGQTAPNTKASDAKDSEDLDRNDAAPNLAVDLEQLRADARDGLVPVETYWEAAGLNVEQQRRRVDAQQARNQQGYWSESY